MKILVVHFSDDNFGDMLIEHCFSQLIKVVADNLGIAPENYKITAMGLKNHNRELIVDSDIICFAGGGVFGISYLNLFEHLSEILTTAEEHNISVIFSSIGVNNMDVTDDNVHTLSDLLKLSCIKAISVRENPQLFNDYICDEQRHVAEVCDSAVWTSYVYHDEIKDIIKNKTNRDKKVIGINVVRGGLFSDNGKSWSLGKEAEFLFNLKQLIEKSGYECKFYTNGSTLDNNTMLYIRDKYDLPEDDLIFVDNTKDLVQTIADFDSVVAIRLHSAIICYSLDVPVVNLVWNDKINLFYNAINRPDYAISLDDCTEEKVFSLITDAMNKGYKTDDGYLMTLYRYLYDTFRTIADCKNAAPIYSADTIKAKLQEQQLSCDKEFTDMKVKLYKGQKRYFSQFTKLRNKDSLLKKTNTELDSLKNTVNKQNKKITEQKIALDATVSDLKKTQDALKKAGQKSDELKKELDYLERQFLVRVFRKLERIKKRMKS